MDNTLQNLPIVFDFSTEYFSLADTLECGQVFRYKKIDSNTYCVFSTNKFAVASQNGNKIVVQADRQNADYFWNYFDLNTNYKQKVDRISALSPIMQQASTYGKGIRILNQDPLETTFSFIISANNNIKRIQTIIERMCSAIGTPTPYGNAFPTVQQIASKPTQFFTDIGAGYRDKYLKQTAQQLLNFDISSLKNLPTEVARQKLLTFQGIGPKVADCILLFGLNHGDVFPVDTWLKKVYHQHFETGLKDDQISQYFCNLFGQDAGLCQQYLFYFQRKYLQTNANNVK